MPTLMVLYDTSFIMNDAGIPGFALPNGFTQEHVIAHEVKKELYSHLNSPENDSSARRGRTLAAEIMGRNDYREASLAKVSIHTPQETLLGPDSDTDKRLIAYALSFLATDPSNIVFLATHDGGIQAEVSVQQSQRQKNIFSPVTFAKLQQIFTDASNERLTTEDARLRTEYARLQRKESQRNLVRTLVRSVSLVLMYASVITFPVVIIAAPDYIFLWLLMCPAFLILWRAND